MTIKRLLILAVLIGLGVYFSYSSGGTDEGLMAPVTRFLGGSEANEKRLEALYQELEAKESIMARIDAEIKRIQANPPKPRCKEGTAEVSITDDPRPQLRSEIAALREEIAALEAERAD